MTVCLFLDQSKSTDAMPYLTNSSRRRMSLHFLLYDLISFFKTVSRINNFDCLSGPIFKSFDINKFCP